MKVRYGYYPPVSMAMDAIAKLSDQDFEVISRGVESADAFDTDSARLKSLRKQLSSDIEASSLLQMMNGLEYLYGASREWASEGQSHQEVVGEFLDFTGFKDELGDRYELIVDRLYELLREHPHLDRARKLRWLRTGILDTAIKFTSFVDLRPRFDQERLEIREFVPTVIFQIVTDSENGSQQSNVVQLNMSGFAELKSAIQDVEKKLAALAADKRICEMIDDLPETEKE